MEEFCEDFPARLRCLSPDFDSERYQDDACVTKTSMEQIEVEENVERCIEEVMNTIDINPEGPSLFKEKHIQFLKKGLSYLPSSLEVLDASRSWLCFWILHSLQILDEDVSRERRNR